jgi:pantoate kinase
MIEISQQEARAFAPGHVTGVFRPDATARDPRARGSVGAGVVLELGVRATARYKPLGPRRLRLSSDVSAPLPISETVARRLFPALGGTLSVHLTHELPVGQGFGMSAAGATATALAVAAVFRIPRSHAVEVAHLADLFGGGGLGGVAAILGGGLEIRRRPGVPPYGDVVHSPFSRAILVGVVTPSIPSPRVLGQARWLRRIDAARTAWADLGDHPSPEAFFEASERFTDRVGLAPPRLRAALRALRRREAWAAQAMFGGTFVVLPRTAAGRDSVVDWLSHAGIRAVEVRSDPRGARRLRSGQTDALAPPRHVPVRRAAATLLARGPSRRPP